MHDNFLTRHPRDGRCKDRFDIQSILARMPDRVAIWALVVRAPHPIARHTEAWVIDAEALQRSAGNVFDGEIRLVPLRRAAAHPIVSRMLVTVEHHIGILELVWPVRDPSLDNDFWRVHVGGGSAAKTEAIHSWCRAKVLVMVMVLVLMPKRG